MRHFSNKNFRVLCITLIIILVIGVISLGQNSVVSTALNGGIKALFQLSASATENADTASLQELKEENEKLKEENASLREQLVEYYDTKAENETLLKYYDIKKENPSYKIQPASVIKRDANSDFYSFTLDIGSTDGVSANDAVITGNGLVGWVYRVDATTCTVKTILAPDTKAGAVDKKTSDSGIITGDTSLCDDNLTKLTTLAEDNEISVGDMIVTSGTGGVYPGNLLIGKVTELMVDSYDNSRYAIIEPYEDVRTITSAAVITEFDTEVGAEDE